MRKRITSDINFIIGLINELDDLHDNSTKLLGEVSNEYNEYLLLIRAKKQFNDTYSLKVFDAFSVIQRAIKKVTSWNKNSNKKINTLDLIELIEKEIQESIRNRFTNKNFINLILSEYTIKSLLNRKSRKEALEKFQENEDNADDALKKFKEHITSTKLKYFDGGPPHLKPGNKLIINKENELKEIQDKHGVFRDIKGAKDMEDLGLTAEYLCHTEHDKNINVDFMTADGPLKKSLLFVRKLFNSKFYIWFFNRLEIVKN